MRARRHAGRAPVVRALRRGQTVVEYVLGIAVVVVGIAVGFTLFGESVRGIFDNVRVTLQQPYP